MTSIVTPKHTHTHTHAPPSENKSQKPEKEEGGKGVAMKDKDEKKETDEKKDEGEKNESPDRKDTHKSAAATPMNSDKNAKMAIQKQLASVARGLWHRVSTVVTELCRALHVSDNSLRRSLNVANRILCNAKPRELLFDRHLHQVLASV